MLFEAMAAAAILTVALLFAAKALNAAFVSARTAEEYYRASLLLDGILWELDRSRSDPSDLSGLLERAQRGLEPLNNAVLRMSPAPSAAGDLNAWRVTLTWGSKERLEASLYAARP